MEASRLVLVLFSIVASSLLPAQVTCCKAGRPSMLSKLPIRTFVVDQLNDAQSPSGFAVYQEVDPFWYAYHRNRHRPPYIQLCPYDKLGSHSWPPTAVCWVAPTAPVPASSHIADAAAAFQLLETSQYTHQTGVLTHHSRLVQQAACILQLNVFCGSSFSSTVYLTQLVFHWLHVHALSCVIL